MVYARNKRAAAELSKIIADGGFHKTYVAFVTADPALPPEGELRDMLFFDRNHDKAYVVDAKHPRKGAKEAVLTYETAGTFDADGVSVTKLLVYPQTGRSHQIRVQFGSRRSPLLGDGKYGSRVKYHYASLISCGLQWKKFEFRLDIDRIVPILPASDD
jgi:23S rRNA pseudouridine1911/1915/1917 synthase